MDTLKVGNDQTFGACQLLSEANTFNAMYAPIERRHVDKC